MDGLSEAAAVATDEAAGTAVAAVAVSAEAVLPTDSSAAAPA